MIYRWLVTFDLWCTVLLTILLIVGDTATSEAVTNSKLRTLPHNKKHNASKEKYGSSSKSTNRAREYSVLSSAEVTNPKKIVDIIVKKGTTSQGNRLPNYRVSNNHNSNNSASAAVKRVKGKIRNVKQQRTSKQKSVNAATSERLVISTLKKKENTNEDNTSRSTTFSRRQTTLPTTAKLNDTTAAAVDNTTSNAIASKGPPWKNNTASKGSVVTPVNKIMKEATTASMITNHTTINFTTQLLEKRDCCHHYYDHGHDLMEMHNNPHHWGSDYMEGPAHDEFHSIDEHGTRLDLGDEDLGGGGNHGLGGGGGGGHLSTGIGGGYGAGMGGGGGSYGDGGGGNYNPHTHYNSYHNEPHYHKQNFYNEPHYHEHHHHNNPTFEHNDYHYVDDHHEHYHHQPHYINNEVHIHHEENNNHDDQLEHYGSGHHQNYGHGGYHHVKVNLHGPGKSPEQWHHQEAHEMGGHMGGGGGGGEDDEQLNNYDTGAGFFQLDEHGGEVDITSLHHGGTKVHMGGGHFSVVRDPWRFHSAFAGLLQPHESVAGAGGLGGGMGGGGGIQQFHQHFTYINNERNEKTKVQNLIHHQHEGSEHGTEEHHFSEHHDDHHLHHEHEHRGHHDDMGGGDDHHDDHGTHHHHHEEDEAHHHYEEHHQDALHAPDGGGGYGHGGGGGGFAGAGTGGGGGGMAYTRHKMNNKNEDEYDVKPFPGYQQRGAEQFKGTPEDDNYRQDRAPSVAGAIKRSVKQITPLAALVGYKTTGIKRELAAKEDIKNHNIGNATAIDELDMREQDELSLDRKTMGSIRDEMRLENETMRDDVSSLDGSQSARDTVKKVFFNDLVKHEAASNIDPDTDKNNDNEDFKDKTEDDKLLKDYVPVGSGSGSGEAEKRSVTAAGGGDGGGQEISGNSPLEASVLHGPEAGISRVFIEPMIVKKKKKRNEILLRETNPLQQNKTVLSRRDGIPTGKRERLSLNRRLKLFKKAVFSGEP